MKLRFRGGSMAVVIIRIGHLQGPLRIARLSVKAQVLLGRQLLTLEVLKAM
jgi:hypothetical protein